MSDLPEPTKWEGECIDTLAAMKSGREQAWNVRLVKFYRPVLLMLGETYAKSAVEYAYKNEEWRPSPAQLRLTAARCAMCIAGNNSIPYPSAEDAFAEVLHLVQRHGLYAKPTNRPNVFDEGAPRFSHGLVERTVQQLGGWPAICAWNSKEHGALDNRFSETYARNVERWEQQVADTLALPATMRSQLLFPKWTPYQLPQNWTTVQDAPVRLAIEEKKEREPVPMPTEIRRKFAALRIMPGGEAG